MEAYKFQSPLNRGIVIGDKYVLGQYGLSYGFQSPLNRGIVIGDALLEGDTKLGLEFQSPLNRGIVIGSLQSPTTPTEVGVSIPSESGHRYWYFLASILTQKPASFNPL